MLVNVGIYYPHVGNLKRDVGGQVQESWWLEWFAEGEPEFPLRDSEVGGVGRLEHPPTPFPLVLCLMDRPMGPDSDSRRSGHTGCLRPFYLPPNERDLVAE